MFEGWRQNRDNLLERMHEYIDVLENSEGVVAGVLYFVDATTGETHALIQGNSTTLRGIPASIHNAVDQDDNRFTFQRLVDTLQEESIKRRNAAEENANNNTEEDAE